MKDNLVKSIVARADSLFNSEERVNSENMWRQFSEYMLNNQYDFNATTAGNSLNSSTTSKAKGAKKTSNLYDSTALKAVQDLASAFQGTLTNPATTWSKLRFERDELNNDEASVLWLEEVNKRIHKHLSESNFDTEIAKAYLSLVGLANTVVFHDVREDDNGNFKGFQFKTMHLGQIAWAENMDGVVDTVFRKFRMTARQAFQKWGTNVSPATLKALDKEPDTEFEFIHAIFPRDKKQVKLNEVGLAAPEKRPVASIYIQVDGHMLVENGGYYESPIYAARWSLLAGEVYGRGPGHYALPDVKTLNRLKKRGLEAIDLQVRPPILANMRDVIGQLDLRPGQISVVKNVDGIRELQSVARTDVLQFSEENLKNSINSIFFLDKLLLPPRTETGEMTAFEIAQRTEQMQRVLGPTLSRLNSEMLQPLIVRAFKILLRNGRLPQVPEALLESGVDVDIVFVNQLARAQQQEDISSIQRWVQNIGMLAQMKPEVLDLIDADGIAKHTAKILGVPEIAVTNNDVVEQIRQQRAQQMQQQAALDQANLAADTASKIPKE